MTLSMAKSGLALFFAVFLAIHLSSCAFAMDEKIEFQRCQIQHKAVEIDAQCASLTRPENPQKPNGRTIDLFVVKLPSHSPTPEKDAFTVIQGGPGGSSIDMAIDMRQTLDLIRAKRDILLVDQRGTGRSNGLYCDTAQIEEQMQTFDRDQTLKMTQQCFDKLGANDLRFYSTSVAVQDLEAIRQAAAYSQLSLYGVSYGTRVAQHYLRRFPEQTRLVIIDGVVDIGLNLAGAEIARRSQDAFDAMVERCNQTPDCVDRFGDIALKFKQLRARLAEQTVDIELAHPVSGETVKHTVTETDLLASVRFLPYATESLSLLPLVIAKAHAGDYLALAAQGITVNESLTQEFATGMHNSVMCSEDGPFVDDQASSQASNTYFGSDMIDALAAVCEIWPAGIIDEDFLQPFDSKKPVLILSGETDPITPPANGERAAKMFSNSKHLVVPAHGHGVINRGCVPFLVRNFIENADLDKLNTDCIERERPMPFFIDTTGPTP